MTDQGFGRGLIRGLLLAMVFGALSGCAAGFRRDGTPVVGVAVDSPDPANIEAVGRAAGDLAGSVLGPVLGPAAGSVPLVVTGLLAWLARGREHKAENRGWDERDRVGPSVDTPAVLSGNSGASGGTGGGGGVTV